MVKMNTSSNNRSIISIITRNRRGVLARLSATLSARWLQIHALNTSVCYKSKDLHQITITAEREEDESRQRQLLLQLERVVPVLKASVLDDKLLVEREIALIKVTANEEDRAKALEIAEDYHAYPVDLRESSVIFEVVGTTFKIDELLEKFKAVGLAEYSRSGSIVMQKGKSTMFDDIEEVEGFKNNY